MAATEIPGIYFWYNYDGDESSFAWKQWTIIINDYITDITENAPRLLTTIEGQNNIMALLLYDSSTKSIMTNVFALTVQFWMGLACGCDSGDGSF